ncbi:unnamed protein product [Zymoseptoria tritici ST99CH_1A5]|uniref:Uncharacterized protein n=1 Tax=Zymoseptoria tritici ST99CH_1A5 TaxID=1276529 RepID=A0A1Y6LIN3_ZYMTR|nr:unnamed protein product [Zymoseptoria tritici ST99CH_1A5]
MALKRKRSSPAFSSPSSDNSEATTQSSPMGFFYQQSKPVQPLFHKPTWSFPTYDDQASIHLNSRTRKRHRDNRPDEESIYASTIHKLYDAQRQHPHASPIYSETNTMNSTSTVPAQRSTLHSFWRIPKAPATVPMALEVNERLVTDMETFCEDCDKPLRHTDAMDIDQHFLEEDTSCKLCQRMICDTCAMLGDVRVCLPCASN